MPDKRGAEISSYLATAGWAVPRQHAAAFPASGSLLERYAARLPAVEINSSFYRPHRPATWARWAASVPDGFRFAVKVPKLATHEARLAGPEAIAPIERLLAEVCGLGEKLGPLLVQLPPSLAFDGAIAERFFSELRARFEGWVACEPRHATWFEDDANALLDRHRVARVAADPARVPEAAVPGGWDGLVYVRWHGSPRIYFSAYEDAALDTAVRLLLDARIRGSEAWCVFDNTAHGHALGNAVGVWESVRATPARRRRAS